MYPPLPELVLLSLPCLPAYLHLAACLHLVCASRARPAWPGPASPISHPAFPRRKLLGPLVAGWLAGVPNLHVAPSQRLFEVLGPPNAETVDIYIMRIPFTVL